MTLAQHIRSKNWDELEKAWNELIVGSAEPGPALDALKAASQVKEIPRCLGLVREHGDMLLASDRAADAARLYGSAMLLGGSPGELGKPLWEAARTAWSESETWNAFVEISGLSEHASDMRGAWKAYGMLESLEPGRVIYHAKGWGLGRVESVDEKSLEATIKFLSGKKDRFPYATCVDIFEVLDADDLRAKVVLDPEGLAKQLADDPLEVLRWVVKRNGGRIQHAGIKLAMATLGVEGPKFTAWWRKARKQAETSEWFELSGSTTKVVVRLLDKAEDPAIGLRRQLQRSSSLGQALMRVKTLAGGELDPEVRRAATETLEELALQDGHKLQHRLAVLLFLREDRGETPPALAAMLERAQQAPEPPDPSQPPAIWQLFQRVPGLREQEKSIELMRELHGDQWLDQVAEHLPHAPPGMARSLVDALLEDGRSEVVVKHYISLLARPTRNPTVLVRLADRVESGQYEDQLPAPLQRVQCLLQLAVHLDRTHSGNPEVARARTKLSDVLAKGSPSRLCVMMKGANLETVRSLASMIEPGVERSLDRLFTKVAIEISPDVFRGDEKPFWYGKSIWTTRKGLKRKEDELRELRDVKIPANAEAIGKAASFGDLSENSEWEAAIEDQRTLTSRAMELESMVRDAQMIENAAIPENMAAPGTEVTYADKLSGTEETIRILGPWDDDAVSYRSPLAQALLGKKPGDSVTVQLPSGTQEIELRSVRLLDI
ncbi:MAG: GreA/GreB family elongation factor [Planctomycetota bacterium]